MKEFAMIFRMDALPEVEFSPEEMNSMMTVWENWMNSIIEQNILVSRGKRLNMEGKTIKRGMVVTNGPYAEIKEILGGFIIIQAHDLDAAVEIAKTCPMIIGGGGTVEIRGVYPPPVN